MQNPSIGALPCIVALSLFPACADGDKEALDGSASPAQTACEVNWEIESVVPCVAKPTLTEPPLIYSSHLDAAGNPACDPYIGFPQPVPDEPWSEQSVIAEVTGDARLCISMKQGKADAPTDDDCTLFEHCADVVYETEGVRQALPPIPAWAASDEACSRSYYAEGGYIELRASSSALGCAEGGDQIKRIQMCPLDCESGDTRDKCETCVEKTNVTGVF